MRSQDSSVKWLWYELDNQGIIRFTPSRGKTFFLPARVRDFSLPQSINTTSETQPFSNLMGTDHSFHLMMRLRSKATCALVHMPLWHVQGHFLLLCSLFNSAISSSGYSSAGWFVNNNCKYEQKVFWPNLTMNWRNWVTTQKMLSHNSWYLAEFQTRYLPSKSQRCYCLIWLAQSDEYKTTGNDINIIFNYLCHIPCLYLCKIPRKK